MPTRRVEDACAALRPHLGTAFQLVDDVLDYDGRPRGSARTSATTCAEGKLTLPLI